MCWKTQAECRFQSRYDCARMFRFWLADHTEKGSLMFKRREDGPGGVTHVSEEILENFELQALIEEIEGREAYVLQRRELKENYYAKQRHSRGNEADQYRLTREINGLPANRQGGLLTGHRSSGSDG